MKRIEDIVAGDKIMAADPETLEVSEKTVLETYVRQVDKLVHLIINGEEIATTDNHPFYVQGRGFINAGNLLIIGDTLVSVNGEDMFIEKCYIQNCKSPATIYNFQVEDYHTYFVGSCGVWVHNAEKYINEKRVPQDKETILSDKSKYTKTSLRVKGAAVYKGKDGNYHHRDTFHTGGSAHLEVFNKQGIHLGEAAPITGEIIPGTADPSKTLKIK